MTAVQILKLSSISLVSETETRPFGHGYEILGWGLFSRNSRGAKKAPYEVTKSPPECFSVSIPRSPKMGSSSNNDDGAFDVLIVGTGISGICSLYHIRDRFPSWRVRALEAAPDVGGTWYWNRYPGCRFDSESVSYGFSFDQELLEEWHWKETFSSQPETLKYLQHVAKKHNLYDAIQFNTRIKAAQWDDGNHRWTLTDDKESIYETKFLVTCLGFLSAPTLPEIPGIETFSGQAFHTSRWPSDFDIDCKLADKRVGVIGTGASGIQLITALSKVQNLRSLNVFQRTANWCAPLRNATISREEMEQYRKKYNDIFERCGQTKMCFLHDADPRRSLEVSHQDRIALWNKLYEEPGFGKWLGVFSDTYTDRHANELYTSWMADKFRQRVHDSEVAETLIPTHPFGGRRVPLESGYLEVFNDPNVNLVDLEKTPIQRISSSGIVTTDGKQHDLDVLFYATGFNAITGAFQAIDWHGKQNRYLMAASDSELADTAIWIDHWPRTNLGITVPSMPNMFMVLGPHQPFGNTTRNIEHTVEVICNMLQHCVENGYTCMEPTEDAADKWTAHVLDGNKDALVYEVDSWMSGINTNVKGKSVRKAVRYNGSAMEFRRRCEECRVSGYPGFIFA